MTSVISRRHALAMLGGSLAIMGLGLSPTMAADAPTVVHVSIIPIYSVAPHFAADAQGYFAAENIAVTTQPVQTGAVGIPGLISGAFDVLYTNTVSVTVPGPTYPLTLTCELRPGGHPTVTVARQVFTWTVACAEG